MAKINLTEIELGLSKLRTADLALTTICDDRNDRDLDHVHHVIQIAPEQVERAIQDEEEANAVE